MDALRKGVAKETHRRGRARRPSALLFLGHSRSCDCTPLLSVRVLLPAVATVVVNGCKSLATLEGDKSFEASLLGSAEEIVQKRVTGHHRIEQ